MSSQDTTKFVELFRDALKNEQKVDVEDATEMLEKYPIKRLVSMGLAVSNLTIGSMKTGLGGKCIIELEADSSVSSTDQIEAGRIGSGDIVKVETQSAKSKASKSKASGESKNADSNDAASYAEGVVTKVTKKAISVAIDPKFEDAVVNLTGRLWLSLMTNLGTYKRMDWALGEISKIQERSRLGRLLLGMDTQPDLGRKQVKFLDKSLNAPQRAAVEQSLGSEICLIHGPPGTGKTYTIVEIIRQLVASGERVLVCGPSNISVDNILERLSDHIKGNQLVRLGHPARLLESNLMHSIEIVSKTSDQGVLLRNVRSDIDSELGKLKKARFARERRAVYAELKELRKEYRQREKDVVSTIIKGASVVVSTLHGAGSFSLTTVQNSYGDRPLFDTIIIDEVSQSTEPQCWIPLVACPLAKRLVIAGDNQQLPPTVKSTDAKFKKLLETTIFDRLLKLFGEKIKCMLSIQYRMNTTIMDFPSRQLYESKLAAADSVKDRVLADLAGVESNPDTNSRVVWIDTQGGDFPELPPEEGDQLGFSHMNESEARAVRKYIERLDGYGVEPQHIGVISPYSAQVTLLKELLESYEGLEISTVDGFQGREKEVIIISLVRSNDNRIIGFLSDDRRINVAITRPKRQLCVIGDTSTVANSKFLKAWVDWVEENADIEYPDIGDVLA